MKHSALLNSFTFLTSLQSTVTGCFWGALIGIKNIPIYLETKGKFSFIIFGVITFMVNFSFDIYCKEHAKKTHKQTKTTGF